MSLKEADQSRLIATIAKALSLEIEEVTLDRKRETYENWDSLKHFEVMLAVEQEFDLHFTSTELTQSTELEDIQTLISKHLT